MFFDIALSKLHDAFHERLDDYTELEMDEEMAQMSLYLWELKFLDIFVGLHSLGLTGAGEWCDAVNVTAQKITKHLRNEYEGEGEDEEEEEEEDSEEDEDRTFRKIRKAKLELRDKYSYSTISEPTQDGDPKFAMKFIDAVAENLNVVLRSINDPRSIFYAPEPYMAILQHVLMELELLRFFICFLSEKSQQKGPAFFTHALFDAANIAMVVWLYFPLQRTEQNVLLSDVFQMKIKSIRRGVSKFYVGALQALKSTIIQQQPNDYSVKMPAISGTNDELREMLDLLRANIIQLPILDPEFGHHNLDAVIIDAGLLIYLLSDTSGEEEGTVALEDVNCVLGFHLPNDVRPLWTMVYLIIQMGIQSHSPRIRGLGYVDFLLNILKEIQHRYLDSLAPLVDLLQKVEKELEGLQSFLKVVVEIPGHKLHALPEDCSAQLINNAYEVEYIVDACISKDVPHRFLEFWLLDIIKQITRIKVEATRIQERKTVEDTSTAHMSSNLASTLRIDEEIVGFDDVTERLKDQLLRGTRGRDVISITGMAGQGKTTLAYKIYHDRSVVSHFDILAECCVSRVYSPKELLLTILRDAIGEDPKRMQEDSSELADKLRKALISKRYLILIDDIWESSAWDDLVGCFPENNGSRIILTTRNLEVAEYTRLHSDPLKLRMFNDDESWKLFQKKVFGEESCPLHLMNIGQHIMKKCGGLPLSISLVAGILASVERNVESWEKVANHLGPNILTDSKHIVEKSYDDLPYHLRPCFLYFGVFLEDIKIKVTELIRLWKSEAFIISREGQSLDDIAEGYLENLIGRNLVMVAHRSDSDNKVEACRLHDVLLDFCKEKAAEENFLQWINRDQKGNRYPCVYSHKQPAQLVFSEVDNLREWNSSCSFVGSLHVFNALTPLALTISHIFERFKFLKVLNLDHKVVIDFIPNGLVNLRYFSARINQKSIPSSICNLWQLETLILTPRRPVKLPATVWEMRKLRHLHVHHLSFSIKGIREENSPKLLNDLETLSTLKFRNAEEAEMMWRRCPNLRELRCEVGDSCRVLNIPTKIEVLEINEGKHGVAITTALNLKTLELNRAFMDTQQRKIIAQL